MPSIVNRVAQKQLAPMPSFLSDSIQYEVMMGSEAYGVSSGDSDVDVYALCIPDKEIIFPHLAGYIEGFGTHPQRFETWDPHHVKDEEKNKEYDFCVHNIIKYFNLCLGCNPNIIDSLFVPARCVYFMTPVGEIVRENRKKFLTKEVWPRFKGYAYSTWTKLKTKEPKPGSKRDLLKKQYGFDTKFAYHIVRLLSECEQILVEGDLVLDEKDRREHMKAIRAGLVTEDEIGKWFDDKQRHLENIYQNSKLPEAGSSEAAIKNLLLDCLEMHFGNLNSVVVRKDRADVTIGEILKVLQNQRYI